MQKSDSVLRRRALKSELIRVVEELKKAGVKRIILFGSLAKHDLDDADFSLEGERFNLACFLSQQAAEKALKAYLIENKNEPWGHSVAELCEAASLIDTDFKNIKKRASTLDTYYIPTRYPNGLPGGIPSEAYQKEDAERALSICEGDLFSASLDD